MKYYNLGHLYRRAAQVCMSICLAAMMTGVLLQLHLLSHEQSREHESEHCPICQQLLSWPGKFVLESEHTFEISSQIEYCVDFQNDICIKQSYNQQFGPRSPPTLL